VEVRRLWFLAAMQGLAHGHGLVEPESCSQVIGAAGAPTRRAASPLENRWTRYLATLDETALITAGRVISACEARATGGRIGRMKIAMQAQMAAHDEERRATTVCVKLLQPAPTELSLWQLPPGEPGNPYHHRLGQTQLVLVLAGRPTLRAGDARRQLHEGEAVALSGSEDDQHELIRGCQDSVRFLALRIADEAGPVI
jgi:hypothetical protein